MCFNSWYLKTAIITGGARCFREFTDAKYRCMTGNPKKPLFPKNIHLLTEEDVYKESTKYCMQITAFYIYMNGHYLTLHKNFR